jgi:hypothetical protein
MSKTSPSISPYVQQAIREKAERDLAALDVRLSAFDAVDRALDALVELSGTLGQSTPAIAQTAPDPSVVTKLKKLRRSIDDARGLAEEIATALDVQTARASASDERRASVEALTAAGIDAATLSPGGEAE